MVQIIKPHSVAVSAKIQFRAVQRGSDGHEVADFRIWRKKWGRWVATDQGISQPIAHLCDMHREAARLTQRAKDAIFWVKSSEDMVELKEIGERVNRLVSEAQNEIRKLIAAGETAVRLLLPDRRRDAVGQK